jgi:Arc/MetJ family transcription regulator
MNAVHANSGSFRCRRGCVPIEGGRAATLTRRLDPAYYVYKMSIEYTHVRTNIVIDDKLMRDALRATGLRTKRAAVEEGLRTLVRLQKQARIRNLRGKLPWHGDLGAMRRDA